jgi:hypothetical protein
MEFIRDNVGHFELLPGGFGLEVSWGFLVGVGGTYLFCKYLLYRKKAR